MKLKTTLASSGRIPNIGIGDRMGHRYWEGQDWDQKWDDDDIYYVTI